MLEINYPQYATYGDVLADTYQPHNAALNILDMTPEELGAVYDAMDDLERDEFEKLIRTSPTRALMPHQIIPEPFAMDRWWETFLLIGGRGVAKTTTGAFGSREHLRHNKRKARIGVGAPTQADARDVCAEGETGIITMFPSEFSKYNRSLGEARHIDGGWIFFRGTEKPKRWNGPQWSMIWFDELALCNQIAWDDANLGLRLKGINGEHPYALATTTPKNRKFVKDLAQNQKTYVPQYIDEVTGEYRIPTTYDNPYLPQRRVDWFTSKFGGTRLGRQELLGMFIDDVAGARFDRNWIEDNRLADIRRLPRMIRTVVTVDPAGSVARQKADENALSEDQRMNKQKNADTGIAVIGLGVDGRFYVLALMSGQWTPTEWALKAIELFHLFHCSNIIAESNFGGLMVENTIRTAKGFSRHRGFGPHGRQLEGRFLPIKLITASKGKHIRSEPVETLYEQGRVSHTRVFAAGEDQMCAFVSADENEGADMVDALVWGVLELAGIADTMGTTMIVTPGDKRFPKALPSVGNFIKTIR